MKIKAIVFFLCAFLSVNAFSQFRLGVTAKLTSSTIKASDIVVISPQDNKKYQVQSLSDAKVGVQAGLVAQIILGGFFIQPEFLLAYTGGAVKVTDITDNISKENAQRFTRLDIPVLIGRKMGPLRLGIGPVASIILSKPSDAWNFSTDNVNSKYKSATFGYQVGAGLDLWKLAIDLKYEGNLSKLGNGVDIGGKKYAFDSRNRQWIFGVSWFF